MFILKDRDGQALAEITPKRRKTYAVGVVDGVFTNLSGNQLDIARFEITTLTQDVRRVLADLGTVADALEYTDDQIKSYLESRGFSIEAQADHSPEPPEASPEQNRLARYIHESNLIENISEASFEGILRQIIQHSELGHVAAWRFLEQNVRLDQDLTIGDLCHLHRLISEEQLKLKHPIEDQMIGKVRAEDELIGIGHKIVKGPSLEDLQAVIDQLNSLCKAEQDEGNELLSIAMNHMDFEKLHPFADGNGRIGRLLINYFMMSSGKPLIVFSSEKKQKYYQAFKEDSPKLMAEFFQDCINALA